MFCCSKYQKFMKSILKKFHIGKRVLALVTTLSVLITCLCFATSCQETVPPSSTAHTTEVRKPLLQEYGPYVFIGNGRVECYDRKTQSMISPCLDPECDGTCLLEDQFCLTRTHQITDDRLYFGTYNMQDKIFTYAYLDLLDGRTHVLKEIDQLGDYYFPFPIHADDEALYFSQYLLSEGGSPENVEDYRRYLCRLSLTNGSEELLFEIEEDALLFISGEYAVTLGDGILYKYDMSSSDKEVLLRMDDYGFTNIAAGPQFYNGRLYYIFKSTEYRQDQYTSLQYPVQYLVSLDLATGEVRFPLSMPVSSFLITEDALYYLRDEIRYLYVPDNYETRPENIVRCLAGDTLYACDHDGGNERAVYTNADLLFAIPEYFTIIDDVLYGWFADYEEEQLGFGDIYYGEMNLSTGKLIRAATDE